MILKHIITKDVININTKPIVLDINKKFYDILTAKQGDTKSRFLFFKLLDRSIPLDLLGKKVICYLVKPDSKKVFNYLVINDAKKGYCTLELTNQVLAVNGIANLELMITQEDKKLTTIPFKLEVVKSLNDGFIESTHEFNALMDCLASVEAWDKEFEDKSGKLEELYTPRLSELSSQMEESKKQNSGVVQVNLQYYQFLVSRNDWSTAIEKAILDNEFGEIFIPNTTKDYDFSRSIILRDNNSLKIDIGVTIRAIAQMDIFIQRHGTKTNLTREYNPYNRIYGNGFIDCSNKAKVGISLCGYRGYKLKDLTILDALNFSIISKAKSDGYAVELIVNDLRIENRIDNNNLGTCGILLNSTDNHLSDITLVDIDFGIVCEAGSDSNRLFRVHHWMRNKLRFDTTGKCISFKDFGLCNTWDTCYSDTSNIGFQFTGGGNYINCASFNSQHFGAIDVTAFEQVGTPNYITSFTNCTVQSDIGIGKVERAWKGIINDKLKFINCRTYGIVPIGFPKNPLFEGDTFNGRKVVATGNVESPWFNFSPSKAMTCNEGNVITLNGNPQLQFVSVPLSYTSPGKRGQVAHDDRYFYIYIVNVGWKRLELGQPW